MNRQEKQLRINNSLQGMSVFQSSRMNSKLSKLNKTQKEANKIQKDIAATNKEMLAEQKKLNDLQEQILSVQEEQLEESKKQTSLLEIQNKIHLLKMKIDNDERTKKTINEENDSNMREVAYQAKLEILDVKKSTCSKIEKIFVIQDLIKSCKTAGVKTDAVDDFSAKAFITDCLALMDKELEKSLNLNEDEEKDLEDILEILAYDEEGKIKAIQKKIDLIKKDLKKTEKELKSRNNDLIKAKDKIDEEFGSFDPNKELSFFNISIKKPSDNAKLAIALIQIVFIYFLPEIISSLNLKNFYYPYIIFSTAYIFVIRRIFESSQMYGTLFLCWLFWCLLTSTIYPILSFAFGFSLALYSIFGYMLSTPHSRHEWKKNLLDEAKSTKFKAERDLQLANKKMQKLMNDMKIHNNEIDHLNEIISEEKISFKTLKTKYPFLYNRKIIFNR